jgi:hypothetical protein
VRSARRVHIFASSPAEAGLVSVPAAKLGVSHAVICADDDAAIVTDIAAATGSSPLANHRHWVGIPAGWCVLSGYIPTHAAAHTPDATLGTLNPAYDLEIKLLGGLAIRPEVFAEGHPPRIEISLPEGVSVRIDGEQAFQNSDGSWEGGNWSHPGKHLIDVVPGPSLSYEIIADPANSGGWEPSNAHDGRFSGDEPWARTRICGARFISSYFEIVTAPAARTRGWRRPDGSAALPAAGRSRPQRTDGRLSHRTSGARRPRRRSGCSTARRRSRRHRR